ncbi:hypothetical protein ABVZ06_005048 [Escherichia coli]|nr:MULTISPECIES: hypothetical protein [Enterobacteriaceae]EAA9542347.1 hypothetical protein [Salmonella enterica subsp. enterica]EAN6818336.1 hypothetical protein [Salmonella enterica]EGT4286529.1 hypothetical protein [Cronobacter sakazakii]MCP5870750.1 hypothetical protein [Klebsiella pneumoniae]EAR7556290.1 hypothetical protein [Salmonella enterica]
MTKKMEKIEDRVSYHQKQLAQLKAKKKEELSKEKKAEKAKRASKNILLGASICKVLGIDYTEIDEYLPKIVGLFSSTVQYINDPKVLAKGTDLLESWKNGGDRNE